MTGEKALKMLRENLPLNKGHHDVQQGYNLLNNLVEKDTPKKVNKSVEWNYKCSNCKEYINRDYGENKYCGNCGQKLDWSDSNENKV